MTATFYGVLGVESDADTEAIDESYRERVTDVHPDVNDDPDADAQFQRLTTARDVLTDRAERARYDRLGHVSYLRHHVDCSAWTDFPRSECSPSGESDAECSPSGESDAECSPSGESDGSTDSDRMTDAQDDERDIGRASSETGQTDSESSSTESETASTASKTTRTGNTQTARTDSYRSRETDPSNGTRSVGEASTRDVTGAYAATSFWEVGFFRRAGDLSGAFSGIHRFGDCFRRVSPWGSVHVAFLVALVATSLYYFVVLADTTVSAPLVLALVGELGLAVVLSSIHVLSRLVR